MAAFTPAYAQVHPNLFLPEKIVQVSQASGAFDLLATGKPMVRLGEGDLFVYMGKLAMQSQAAAGQTPYNQLPSCALELTQISTPTYLFRNRAEYDHHDTAAASKWNVGLPNAYTLAMRQGQFLAARGALLYGVNPSLGEGLLNAAGATTVSLPADTFGDTTVVTYDNGQMAQFLLSQIAAAKTRMFQVGYGQKLVFLAPQRFLTAIEYNIVQLTAVQRPGAGSLSGAGTVKMGAEWNEDEVLFLVDDTLIGKGAGGTDMIVLVIPEIEVPAEKGINTNVFADLGNNMVANTLQLCDMAAPREISAPLPAGAVDVVSEWRITSGWALRPESITLISAQYQ